MHLNKKEYKELQYALLSAFPNKDDLEQMVRLELGQNLEAISSGEKLSTIVFKLIQWAECNGKLQELITGGCQENPDNPELKAFHQKWQKNQNQSQLDKELEAVESSSTQSANLQPPPSDQNSGNNSNSSDDKKLLKIENSCYQEIMKPGALIRIKSSNNVCRDILINRIITYVRGNSYETVNFSFKGQIDSINPINMERFLQLFCIEIGKKIGLQNRLDKYTDEKLTHMINTTNYFEKYLLKNINTTLVLVLDDVDIVFENSDIAGDFCSLLRDWHELAKSEKPNSNIWSKLRLIIIHSTEKYPSIDIRSSPLYNVGFIVNL